MAHGGETVQLAQRGFVSIIGAIIGLLSLLLPWVVFSASEGGATASIGLSPVQFIAQTFGPQTSSSSSTPADPAIIAWEQSAVLGLWLWLIGTFAFGIGCVLAIVQPFVRSRIGGIVMLVGSGMGGAGIASFSASFPTSSGVQLSVGPTYGIAVALTASFVTLLSFFLRDVPLTLAPPAGAFPSQLLYPPQTPSQPWQPTLTQTVEPPPPTQTAPLLNQFCPTCGQRYQEGYKICSRDGTELKFVASELVACPRCGASVRTTDRFCSNCGFQGRIAGN
jgi:Double zinc ribbon